MARILIRRHTPNTSSTVGGDSSINGIISGDGAGNVGTIEFPIGPITGEPDESDSRTARNDRSVSRPIYADGEGFVNPDTGTRDSGDTTRKRRGRKPGSKNKNSGGNPAQTGEVITDLLFSIHLGVSTILHSEALAITQDEAKKLGEASVNVMRHYNIPLLDEKTRDWLKLFVACGSVYGSRFMAMSMAKKKGPRVVTMPPPVESGGVSH
jgi:hypothetical protein